MQLINSGPLNMFKYIQKSWLKSSFLESLTSLDWLLYPTENELSGSKNSEWNLRKYIEHNFFLWLIRTETRRGSPVDRRPFPAEASPIGQIHPFSRMAVTDGILMPFRI